MRSLTYSEHRLVGTLGDVTEFNENEGIEGNLIRVPFCVVLPGLVSLVLLQSVKLNRVNKHHRYIIK